MGGVQLAEADIFLDGAGEQVGVLQYDAQALPQGVLFDFPHVDAVVGDAAVVDVVEPVDQVGDGRLSGAGGAYKGDLLPRFGVKANMF